MNYIFLIIINIVFIKVILKYNFNKMLLTNEIYLNEINKNISELKDYKKRSIEKSSNEIMTIIQEITKDKNEIMELSFIDKEISCKNFKKITNLLIKDSVNNSLLEIFQHINYNCFIEESKIDEFKYNCEDIIEKYKFKVQQRIFILNYEISVLEKLNDVIELKYIECWNKIENNILIPLGLSDIPNNKILKQKFRNKFNIMIEELIEYIKKEVKE